MASQKTYTITQNGLSKGLTILQPFTIEVHQTSYVSLDGTDDDGNPIDASYLAMVVCTKTNGGSVCDNDQIANRQQFGMPASSESRDADWATYFEALLETEYPGNWS